MSDTPIQHVSDTATWVATYRAIETARPDALFRDPLAALLVGERGPDMARQMQNDRPVAWSVVIRTCIIDDYIAKAVASGVDTVLNLGAGLDTRPYRMSLPPTLRWIEVDYPHLIEFKEERLRGEKTVCTLERHKLDLADRPARLALFKSIDASSGNVLVLTEGVIPYLANDDAASLGRDLRTFPHFNFWVVDYLTPQVLAYMRRGRSQLQMRHAPFLFNPPDWTQFFAQLGWQVRDCRYTGEESERLKRPYPAPLIFRILAALMPEKRRRAMRRMAGYALLEPSAN